MKIEKPAICYETGIDESFLVGTKDELVAFAQSIIELVNGPTRRGEYLGIGTEDPIVTNSLNERMSEIVLDGVLIVNSLEDRRELMNRIRVNNGVVPIDWSGHDHRQS